MTTDDLLDARAVELWLNGEPHSATNNNNNNNNNNHCKKFTSKSLESILDYLRNRFANGRIYTESNSSVLIAMNNWNESDEIHSEAFVRCYKNKKRFRDLAPHLYRMCRWCYRATYEQSRDQCLVFLGEMGSGKTRNFDRAVRFIGNCFSNSAPGQVQKLHHVQTLLKAFGGVKFKDIDEACRYSQLLEIDLDYNGVPHGARVSILPLDRTRIMEQMSMNGGFNIFYALLLGADLHLLKSIKLQRNPNFYAYLKNDSSSASSSYSSGVCSSGESWRKYFLSLKTSLVALNFSNSEIHDLFKLLAIILKLGNVTFRACINVDGSVGCCLHNEIEFLESADLLGFENKDEFRAALTKRNAIFPQGQSATVGGFLDVLPDADEFEAKWQRDSACDALWNRMFFWITSKINQALREETTSTSSMAGGGRGPSTGGSCRRSRRLCLLDHAGFETIGGQNQKDLDRLLRNYASERLFSHFALAQFYKLQKSYLDEGLQWSPILENEDFNRATIQIETSLDARGAFQSEATTVGVHTSKCVHHQQSSSSSGAARIYRGSLLVKHFFGDINYEMENFDANNRSIVQWNYARLFYKSNNQLAKLLFPEGASFAGNTDTEHRRQTIRKPLSVSGQFRAALSSMLKTLEGVHCNYVICIKPNDKLRPNFFDKDCVERQLKTFRIPSLVRLGTAGFALNYAYEEFLDRYKMLSPLTWPRWKGSSGNARSGVTTILRHQQIPPSQYALGRDKVFLKNNEVLSTLEERRIRSFHWLATVVQRAFRRWANRSDRRSIFDRSQTTIAAHFRSFKARKEFLRQKRAAVVIQAHIRGWRARKTYARMRKGRSVNVLCSWLKRVVIAQYLIKLLKNLPSTSPLSTDWPNLAPSFCRVADDQLRNLYHKWRCRLYRSQVDQQAYFRMREKLAASLVFKDKKVNYPTTVGHPFRGDYVRIRQNSKWRRIANEIGDEYVVFADLVSKLHRSSGKISPELLIVSTNGIVLMDHRTLTLKHRALVGDLVKISISPYGDSVAVLHFKNNSLNRRSGDFVFECRHLVEIVAKMYLVVHNATGKPPFVNISPAIFIDTGTETTELLFHDRETEKDDSEEWTGCFVSTPVLPLKFSNKSASSTSTSNNGQMKLNMADDGSCSSTSESSGCASATTTKLKLVKRGNRIDFYV